MPPTLLTYALLVGHFLADFVFQTDWMALNKSKRIDALAFHVGVYTMVLMIVVSLVLPPSAYPYDSLRGYGLFVLVNMGAHFGQDAITSRINARLWFLIITPTGDTGKIWRGGGDGGVRVEPLYSVNDTGTRHWFFVGIGADQLLHYVTLFLTAGWWLR